MEGFDGATIFFLITTGLLAGAIVKLSLWKKGVHIITNLVVGVVSAIMVGSIGVILKFPDSLLLAFLGTLAILFILNVFNMQSEDIHESRFSSKR